MTVEPRVQCVLPDEADFDCIQRTSADVAKDDSQCPDDQNRCLLFEFMSHLAEDPFRVASKPYLQVLFRGTIPPHRSRLHACCLHKVIYGILRLGGGLKLR